MNKMVTYAVASVLIAGISGLQAQSADSLRSTPLQDYMEKTSLYRYDRPDAARHYALAGVQLAKTYGTGLRKHTC